MINDKKKCPLECYVSIEIYRLIKTIYDNDQMNVKTCSSVKPICQKQSSKQDELRPG